MKSMKNDNVDVKSILVYGDIETIKEPLFSIIIPVYKRYDTFRKALLSAINQDFKLNYEIIIVDNSEIFDPSSENLKTVREVNCDKVLYYVNEKNIGLFGNWNRGISKARGKYVTFCHDDDVLLNDALTNLYDASLKYPQKAIITRFHIIDMEDNYLHYFDLKKRVKYFLKNKEYYKLTLYDFLLGNVTAGVGDLFIRDHLIELGGYDNNYYPCSDYALYAKYSHKYGSVYSNIVTSCVRRGVNFSYDCYEDIPETNYKICSSFIEKLILPKFISRYLLKHSLKEFELQLKNGFGDNNFTIRKNLIVRLYTYILKLKKYSI